MILILSDNCIIKYTNIAYVHFDKTNSSTGCIKNIEHFLENNNPVIHVHRLFRCTIDLIKIMRSIIVIVYCV